MIEEGAYDYSGSRFRQSPHRSLRYVIKARFSPARRASSPSITRKKRLEKVAAEALARKAELLVVGLSPEHGRQRRESAQNARAFGQALSEKTGIPVEFQDERGTTITAHGYFE